jgi:ComF family protein
MHGAVNLQDVAPVDGVWARIGRALWPPRCLLCREPGASGRDLCAACAAALPWNRRACARCALPLAGPGAAPPDCDARAGAIADSPTPVGAGLARDPPPVLGADRPPWTTPDRAQGALLPGEGGAPAPVCGECLHRPPPLDAACAAFVYGFPVDRLLPRLKFHGDLAAGRLLSAAMAAACAGMPRPEALLPLPLARARLRRRGYDQALELARPLARAFGIPLLDGVLVRRRDTAPQSTLDAAARRRNLRGAFAVPAGAGLPAHLALVDDVMTTGATLHAAARALRRAGVARVDAWVCARAP